MARRTKRLCADEEKRSICFQTVAPGVSVAQVALRYAVNANLNFKWRRDLRYAPDPSPAPGLSEGARFLPVEIVEAVKMPLSWNDWQPHRDRTSGCTGRGSAALMIPMRWRG